ncbi:DUF3307 domain-containing protein [Actinopolyspora erythraea]|uniref:DUF3307 domain-containing protein n=1 Tax=Actinopolyspora erythraea TaxID=414996 RepID=A0A099D2D9_9ACTN|nr:DUF3307 domain-containing protein [Actinopolyspora erythraea]ASU77282.1 DUF3307 domain-containing protein [Actinopolyspora erythraea]KGI80234.1 hypothetical protein IL38_19020 [Actinopolyspora erythraea]
MIAADAETALTFAATLPALLVAHHVADHWVQTSHQASSKGLPGRQGQLVCAKHVASYTAVTAGFVGLLWTLLGLPITPAGFAVGQLVSALTHYWADRRWTLRRLAGAVGQSGFYALGSPREGKDDNPSLGTGAYVLDQSWHWLWLFVAALLTALV